LLTASARFVAEQFISDQGGVLLSTASSNIGAVVRTYTCFFWLDTRRIIINASTAIYLYKFNKKLSGCQEYFK